MVDRHLPKEFSPFCPRFPNFSGFWETILLSSWNMADFQDLQANLIGTYKESECPKDCFSKFTKHINHEMD